MVGPNSSALQRGTDRQHTPSLSLGTHLEPLLIKMLSRMVRVQ